MHKPDTARERGSAILIAALVVALVALAYPLSAGPIGWAIIRADSPAWTQPYFEGAYGPVIWLQDHEPTGVLNRYFKFWWR